MTSGADDLTRLARSDDYAELPRIGAYRILREIGRGGMGTVYLGVRDEEAFHKRAAIKVLKRGMDTDAIVGRFRHERQILARLEHPYIATLFDGGTTPDGLPYFAMEYVEGQTITEYCDARRLDTSGRLDLFRKVCAAVQHAHQNLIIHRDIKPANVLVTAEGTPKLLDFGIAKLLDPEPAGRELPPTLAGPQLMTPEYASPEQVRGELVTTPTDVYSLGVLLYELLTGRRPYELTARTPAEIARAVCDSVPARPSTVVTGGSTGSAPGATPSTADARRLRRQLAGDLDTIVLKALSKDPGRRYASADQFSEDIRRHLQGLPVLARRDTFGYRAGKFVRRNRGAVAAAAVTLAALMAGTATTWWQAREARRERMRAEQRFEDVRRLANAALFEIHDAIADLEGATPARKLIVSKGIEYLDKLARDAGDRPDLKRELAAGYLKVGDVQGRPLNPNIGDTAGALASYRKAAALYDSLDVPSTTSIVIQRERATAYTRLSEVLGSTGQTADALAFARKSLDLQTALAPKTATGLEGGVPADVRRELVASHSRVGDLLSATGDTRGAIEHRRTALAMMEVLAATEPEDPANLRQLGVAHQKLGNSLGNPNYPNIGDVPGALKELEQSAAVFDRAIATHPSIMMFRRNRAVIDSNLSDIHLAMKRGDEALADQQRALAKFEALSAADPANVAAVNDVAISLSKVGEMLHERGRSGEAVTAFERALALHQKLWASDHSNDTLKLEVTSDFNRLATAQTGVGLRVPALENHGRAVAMSRELLADNAQNVELRMAVALALTGRGEAFVRFARNGSGPARHDDLSHAEQDYAEAVGILEGMKKDGVIEGSDLKTLEDAQKELARLRSELGRQ